MLGENNKKIDNMDNEIDELLKGKDNLKKDINRIDDEINKQKANFMIVKNRLLKNNKLNDEMTRTMEKLTNEINEMHNQNIALENANHRAVNVTYGIKRETQDLENIRDNIEKEKNLYAKQASDANMEHTQALEKLKNLNEAIDELKLKNSIAETKLKQQKKIYEALKADCNRFEKKHQDAQKEIKEVIEEKTKKQQKYQFLKIELSYKQSVYHTTLTSLEE
jgi:chromosome segregation ATPase